MTPAHPPLASSPWSIAAGVLVVLAFAGATVDFVPAFRMADPKLAWACLGLAVLATLRALLLGHGALATWLRQRWPRARWLLVLVLPWLLAPLLWVVAVRTVPWAWTRAAGFPAQWHLRVLVDERPRTGCDATISHHRFYAWPHALCLAPGARGDVADGLARAELVGHRSVVGFAVSSIRLRPEPTPAAPEVEMEFEYDPSVEVER